MAKHKVLVVKGTWGIEMAKIDIERPEIAALVAEHAMDVREHEGEIHKDEWAEWDAEHRTDTLPIFGADTIRWVLGLGED